MYKLTCIKPLVPGVVVVVAVVVAVAVVVPGVVVVVMKGLAVVVPGGSMLFVDISTKIPRGVDTTTKVQTQKEMDLF